MSSGQPQSLLGRIQHLIEREAISLPVLSPTGLRLKAMSEQKDYDIREVERTIMGEPSLAAEVLRAANSPFFGGLAEIHTIRQAVTRLGLEQVVRLVFLAFEQAKYQARDPQLRAMLQALWRHASSSAVAADWLARRVDAGRCEEAFLGGLLHDVGELLVLRAIDQLKASQDTGFSVVAELIEEVIAETHAGIGAEFLRQRRIPETYCRIARDHHRPDLAPNDTIMAIVRLADLAIDKVFGKNPALVLASTPEAICLDLDEIVVAELEIMLEDAASEAA